MTLCDTTIDWAATGTMLQGVGTVIGSIAVIVAAIIGATSFSTWRRQQITQRHIDRAETILGNAYEARSALSGVRSPMMFANEIGAAESLLAENQNFKSSTSGRQRRMVTCQAYYERLKRTQAQRDKLYQTEPIARAVFGDGLADAIDKLAHQFWIVQVDVESYVEDEGDDPEFSKEIRASMYERRGKDQSKVGVDTADAIKAIEAICIPILRMEMPS